jgi:ATP adenylyltransferase
VEKPLWAPWRLEYILSKKPEECIFCVFPAAPEARDRENLVLHRSPLSFTIMNRYPYNPGHVMVVPRKHVSEIAGLSPGEWSDLAEELRRAEDVVRRVYRPEGMNLGMNLGRPAGAGIEEHLHWHIVPRWGGDTNFMPVIADVRVVPEALDASWERLRAAFEGA